jgi:hypothetical protein
MPCKFQTHFESSREKYPPIDWHIRQTWCGIKVTVMIGTNKRDLRKEYRRDKHEEHDQQLNFISPTQTIIPLPSFWFTPPQKKVNSKMTQRRQQQQQQQQQIHNLLDRQKWHHFVPWSHCTWPRQK